MFFKPKNISFFSYLLSYYDRQTSAGSPSKIKQISAIDVNLVYFCFLCVWLYICVKTFWDRLTEASSPFQKYMVKWSSNRSLYNKLTNYLGQQSIYKGRKYQSLVLPISNSYPGLRFVNKHFSCIFFFSSLCRYHC